MRLLSTCLDAAGETGRYVRNFDWSMTPAGAIEDWPAALVHAVALIMPAQVPMVLLWGQDGIMIYNDAYAHFAGSRHPDLLGRPVREAWAEIADFNDDVIRTVLTGRTLRFKDKQFTLVREGGDPKPVWMDLDYSPVLGEDGTPEGVVAIVVETTDRVKSASRQMEAERLLLHNETRLRSLIEGIPQLVWRSANDGQWVWSSPQWQQYTGQSAEQSLGLGWLEAFHPDDRDKVRLAWAEAAGNGKLAVDARIHNARTRAFRWFTTRASPAIDDAGNVIEWLGTCTEIDELRRLQDRQKVLMRELQHRVRNTLSVIRAIAQKTAATSTDLGDYVMHLDGRLAALARAQAIVTRDPLGGVDLETLLLDEIQTLGGGSEVSMAGPTVKLTSKAGEMLNLAIHELATNALKYGAFSQRDGQIAVEWSIDKNVDPPTLGIRWIETLRNGSATAGQRKGFGTELLTRTLPYDLRATTAIDWTEKGMHCVVTLPLEEVTISS